MAETDDGTPQAAETDDGLTATHQAARRAAHNTASRAIGEITGKLASLALFALLARKVGESQLGVFVFAFAWCQVATIPVGLGTDRLLLRRVAEDRANIHRLFYEVVRLKTLWSLPWAAVSFLVISLIGSSSETRTAVYLLTLGMAIDTISRTYFVLFTAIERVWMQALTVIVQRVLAAALGITALALGHGVVAVCITYTIGAAVGLVLAQAMTWRAVRPRWQRPERGERRNIARQSTPYAAQDVFGVLLAKIDAVILSLLASSAAVGRYGAAYRLLESTSFLSFAVTGAFAAMFTYLGPDTVPTVRAVYQRAMKFMLVLLVPCAVGFAVLAVPISHAFFGAKLAGAAAPLRLLAPVTVLLGVIDLSTSLVVSRREARLMAGVTAIAVVTNVICNLILIPLLSDRGAATAMLITGVVFAVVTTAIAIRTVGRIELLPTVGSSLAAAGAMAAATAAVASSLALGTLVGVVVYLAALIAIEFVTAPMDIRFVVDMLRRQLAPG